MKKLLVIFLILILYSFSTNASEIKNTSETEIQNNVDWDNIVDYVNSKITLYYISEQINKGSIKSEEEKADFEKFKTELAQSDISNIITFNHLKELLNTNYGLTFSKLNVPINDLKNKQDWNTESLLNEVTKILAERQSNIHNSDEFNNLKDSINSFVNKEEVQVIPQAKEENEPSNLPVRREFIGHTTLLILAFLFLLSTIFLLVIWLHVRSENHKNRQIIKDKEIKILELERKIKNPTANTTPNEIRKRRTLNENSRPEIRKNQNYQNNQNNPKTIPIEENKSPEISLSVETKEPENRIEHLYAGKPTGNRILKEISTQSDPQQTIFKLNILPYNNEVAEFEVFHVSNFMTRSITNAPDDYLYRVCNHENTNQEFRKEILTVKKGIANLIDGEWIVNEENKATIKFQ